MVDWYRIAYDFTDRQRDYIGQDEYDEQVFEETEVQHTDYYYVQAETEEEARAFARDSIEQDGRDNVDIWDVQNIGSDDLDGATDA